MLKLNGALIVSLKTSDYIKKLPSLYSILFPQGYEILPNTTELFELEFAFYEQGIISKEEIIKRGAFFKSVDNKLTNHYIICSNNSPHICPVLFLKKGIQNLSNGKRIYLKIRQAKWLNRMKVLLIIQLQNRSIL